ncbi:MAG: cystathionine gamma-synthase family protein [Gemmatimonadota bacterium]
MSRYGDDRRIGERELRPESLMMSYGYRPELSEGALKSPIFQTSTFVFENAEAGKAFFELAYQLREKGPAEEIGLIYSRLNNPDLEILENRLTLWDGAEACATFESGMAAITTTVLEFLSPGQAILHSAPLYGGTCHLFEHILPRFGIVPIPFPAGEDRERIEARVRAADPPGGVGLIFIETPSNPTNQLVDISMCAALADGLAPEGGTRPPVVVDNTFLGPLWQHPLRHGADLVLYSATKYIGGHSDVIAGACLGSDELMKRVRALRTFTGSMAGPWTGWLLMRSLETLKLRMTSQMKNARYVADFLRDHPRVRRVHYLGHLDESSPQYEIFRRQCLAPGGMIAFEIVGGEAEAFRFLNALRLFQLAVSLGGTESLAEHPASMTHSDLTPREKEEMGVSDALVRLSIGVEHHEDLVADVQQALEAV